MNFDYSYLDYAFKNGKVITVNKGDDMAEAAGIKNNKIKVSYIYKYRKL